MYADSKCSNAFILFFGKFCGIKIDKLKQALHLAMDNCPLPCTLDNDHVRQTAPYGNATNRGWFQFYYGCSWLNTRIPHFIYGVVHGVVRLYNMLLLPKHCARRTDVHIKRVVAARKQCRMAFAVFGVFKTTARIHWTKREIIKYNELVED